MPLVVGLGNPGPRYARTRHNVGWWVMETLAARWDARPLAGSPWWRGWDARYADRNVTLLEPLTFMNRSGEAVAVWQSTHDAAEPLLVVSDDVYLPVGTVRLRPAGSSGGHRGLESIERALGHRSWPRLRIGVGAAQDSAELREHVLETFDADEGAIAEQAVARAAACVECWLADGLAAAMNAFNRREPKEGTQA